VKKGKISDRVILQISFAVNETDIVIRKKQLRKLIDSFRPEHVRLMNSIQHRKHFERLGI
jgi:hypothetical protein